VAIVLGEDDLADPDPDSGQLQGVVRRQPQHRGQPTPGEVDRQGAHHEGQAQGRRGGASGGELTGGETGDALGQRQGGQPRQRPLEIERATDQERHHHGRDQAGGEKAMGVHRHLVQAFIGPR
jgi:hypothetical protein